MAGVAGSSGGKLVQQLISAGTPAAAASSGLGNIARAYLPGVVSLTPCDEALGRSSQSASTSAPSSVPGPAQVLSLRRLQRSEYVSAKSSFTSGFRSYRSSSHRSLAQAFSIERPVLYPWSSQALCSVRSFASGTKPAAAATAAKPEDAAANADGSANTDPRDIRFLQRKLGPGRCVHGADACAYFFAVMCALMLPSMNTVGILSTLPLCLLIGTCNMLPLR